MSAKALASPIIGHRGHPRQSQTAAFSCRKICCAHPSSAASRQKLLVLSWNATRWTAAAARPRESCSFARFLKWLPLISLMAGVPAETDKRSHSTNVFFVHSVGKRLWQAVQEITNKRRELTLQADTAVNLCGLAVLFISFFHEPIYCPHTYCIVVGVGCQ